MQEEKVIVVAADNEYEQIKPLTNIKIVKTGIGSTNIIETLKNLPKTTKIINIGYAGSNSIPRGQVIKVKNCKTYHPVAGEFKEKTYSLNGKIDCYTSGDFVVETKIQEPVVFDMELANICALGFENIESYKVVSDTLNINQFYEANFTECFKKIIKEIEEV